MKRGNQIIPKNMWMPIFLSLACNMIAYYGSRVIMADREHYNLSNCLDEQIPFRSWNAHNKCKTGHCGKFRMG